MTTPAEEPPLAEEVARVVHDLRQPMSALRLLADSALQLDLSEEAAAVVHEIAAQIEEAAALARRLSRLVE